MNHIVEIESLDVLVNLEVLGFSSNFIAVAGDYTIDREVDMPYLKDLVSLKELNDRPYPEAERYGIYKTLS